MRRRIAAVFVLGPGIVGACVGDETPNNVNVIVAGADSGTDAGIDTGTTDSATDAGSDTGTTDSGTDSESPDSGTIANVGGLTAWFSGDQGVATNGFAVTSWTSHGGAPITLTAIPNATAPTVTANGIGGKSTIHLDGTAGNGACPCPGFTGAFGVSQMQPFTVIALVNKTRWSDNTYNYGSTLLASAVAPPNQLRLHGYVTSGPAPTWALTGSSAINTNPFSSTDFEAPHVISAVFAAGSSLVRIDGVQRASGTVGAASFGTNFVVGTNGTPLGSFQGEIGEIAVFGRALGDAEMAAVEGHFKFVYGLK